MLAPLLIIVYNRIDHLKKAIESVKSNVEAKETILYVSSDGWKNEEDKIKVKKIREYSRSITGFKSVEIISYDKNLGGDDATNKSREYIFSKYDRLITIEDDNLVSPLFLSYVNKGLRFYENDPRIFSICGYSPFILGDNYPEENSLFKHHEWNAWGFGMWKDKYLNSLNHRESKDYFIDLNKNLRDKFFIKKLNQMSLEYYPHLLFSLKNKSLPEYDYSLGYYCLKNNFFNIYPTQSFTINTGNDGSGFRVKKNDKIVSKMKSEALSKEIPEFKKLSELKINNNYPKYSNNAFVIFIKILAIRLNMFDQAKRIFHSIKY